MDAPAMHDRGAASKRATVRQLGRVSAAADRAERPRCPSAWLAGSRTTFRTSCGINTAGGGLPATPWCRILSRQRRARSRILGASSLAHIHYRSLSDLSIRYFRTITYTSMHACARALHDAVTASTPAASSLLQLVWVQKLGWGRRFLCTYCCSQNIVMVGRTSTVR